MEVVNKTANIKCKKPAKKNPEKGRGLGQVTPKSFGVHPNVSPKRVELET